VRQHSAPIFRVEMSREATCCSHFQGGNEQTDSMLLPFSGWKWADRQHAAPIFRVEMSREATCCFHFQGGNEQGGNMLLPFSGWKWAGRQHAAPIFRVEMSRQTTCSSHFQGGNEQGGNMLLINASNRAHYLTISTHTNRIIVNTVKTSNSLILFVESVPPWRNSPKRARAPSSLMFLNHQYWHTTVGRTPLNEVSARRRDLYRTNTQHSQEKNIHASGGNRTRNPSKRSAADPRLRQLGHWDRFVRPIKSSSP
jgi:hypothetical protein